MRSTSLLHRAEGRAALMPALAATGGGDDALQVAPDAVVAQPVRHRSGS
jgi:hypothetical protein